MIVIVAAWVVFTPYSDEDSPGRYCLALRPELHIFYLLAVRLCIAFSFLLAALFRLCILRSGLQKSQQKAHGL